MDKKKLTLKPEHLEMMSDPEYSMNKIAIAIGVELNRIADIHLIVGNATVGRSSKENEQIVKELLNNETLNDSEKRFAFFIFGHFLSYVQAKRQAKETFRLFGDF